MLSRSPNSQHFYDDHCFKCQGLIKLDERMDHDKENDNKKEYNQKMKEGDHEDDLT